MKQKLAIALVLGAFVVGLMIAFVLALYILRRPAGPGIASTPTVIQQIQSLSELVTVKYVMQKAVIYTNAPTTTLGQMAARLPGFEEDQITLLAQGVAKAGVDLSRLKPEDVQIAERKITLRLPPVFITDVYVDENRTQVLDRKTGLFRSFDATLEKQARQHAWLEMNRAARQGGIEREANDRAREQLSTFLKALGFSEVEVIPHGGK